MSDGTENMQKLAGCVMALREKRHTVLQLAGRTGAHRRTVAKWLQTLEAARQVRPNGQGYSGEHGNGLAVLWEWVE